MHMHNWSLNVRQSPTVKLLLRLFCCLPFPMVQIHSRHVIYIIVTFIKSECLDNLWNALFKLNFIKIFSLYYVTDASKPVQFRFIDWIFIFVFFFLSQFRLKTLVIFHWFCAISIVCNILTKLNYSKQKKNWWDLNAWTFRRGKIASLSQFKWKKGKKITFFSCNFSYTYIHRRLVSSARNFNFFMGFLLMPYCVTCSLLRPYKAFAVRK